MTSHSQSTEHALSSVIHSRSGGKHGLNVAGHQQDAIPQNLKHEIFIIPSTNQFAFGSMGIIDIKEKGIILHDLMLQFNVSAITGLTGTAAGFPNFNPFTFAIQRFEIYINGNCIDTKYPTEQFIQQQFYSGTDEQRLFVNNGQGNYSSNTQRATLASSTNNYYVPLKTLIDETHLAILTSRDEIQLRIYIDQLANMVNVSTLTGTAAATINFVNAVCRITRLDSNTANQRAMQISKSPEHTFFHDLRYGTFTALSGVSQSTMVLTPLVGKVSVLFFVVRGSTANSNQFNFYNGVKDWALLNSSSTNIVGGQQIPSAYALQVLNKYWCQSSYPTETGLGLTNNNAYVYCWSFSHEPIKTMTQGKMYGSYHFQGNEQLLINWSSALSANYQVDVYAFTESILQVDSISVKKISL